MKRLSKKLGLNGNYQPQGQWTKYDDRLMDGIENDDITKIKSALRKKGVSCIKKDSNGRTALHIGCMRGNLNGVKAMLKAEKPDLTVTDESGRTPMHLAARAGHSDCIKCLLYCKSPLDIQDVASMTPLHYAVSGSHEDAVALLLKHGAPVNVKDKDGRTALILAAQSENVNILEHLCAAGAHINSQDTLGRTALMYASEFGLKIAAESLILKGADTSIKDFNEKTALEYAEKSGNLEVVEVLGKSLSNGNQVGFVNGKGKKCEPGNNGLVGYDDISELDSVITAEDSVTLNSSSSFGEASFQDDISQSSPKSPNGLEFGMVEPFEMQKELHFLKAELKNETLRRTKAERQLRSLRMNLEEKQGDEEETPVEFGETDADTILSEIEKSIPSPLKGPSFNDEEDSPLVSSLRGEINALEIQIERLKKELEEARCNGRSKDTKIPLTVYKALKDSQQKLTEEMKKEIETLKASMKDMKEKETTNEQENEVLKEKINSYKESMEKNDKKEKMRELNEKIVSLKIELSRLDQLKVENNRLKEESKNYETATKSEIENLKKVISSLQMENRMHKENSDQKIYAYRNVLLSAYQGNLDVNLERILRQISNLRGCLITEL